MKMQRYLILIVVVFIVVFCTSVNAEKINENIVVISAAPTILPDPALCMDWYDTQVVYNLYSPLVYPTPEGTIRSHLAQDWEALNGELDHWRFKLRRGVKFHDGSEIKSEDIVFSMDRFITMGKGYSGLFGKIISTIVDEYTVDFILEKPSAVFPDILTLFFPLNKDLVMQNIQSGKYGKFGDYGQNWLQVNDAGSGPYRITLHKSGERMEAVRFKEYFLGWENWGPNEEPIEKLVFIMETEPSTISLLLKSGQLQLEANGTFSRQLFKDILNTEGLRLNKTSSQVWTVWMNTKKAPTDDVHFRRAIQYAYDYDAILNEYSIFGAQEAGIYPSALPGFLNIPPQPRQQNLEKAKEELALSKYNPADVKVVFHYSGGLEAQEEMCLQLQSDLAKIGVKVEIVGTPWSKYSAECANPETTPNLSMFNFISTYPSTDFFIYYMYYPDIVGGIYSAHWYANEEIGQLINQSRETLDSEKRIEIYQNIQRKIASKALAFYPYEIPTLFTSQEYLIGPQETFPVVGPNINMHNWRINLTLK